MVITWRRQRISQNQGQREFILTVDLYLTLVSIIAYEINACMQINSPDIWAPIVEKMHIKVSLEQNVKNIFK